MGLHYYVMGDQRSSLEEVKLESVLQSQTLGSTKALRQEELNVCKEQQEG